MKKYTTKCLITFFCIVFFVYNGIAQKIIPDAAKLEITIGSKGSTEESILINPIFLGLSVTDNDDVIILDDKWVKVYSYAGDFKTRFSGFGRAFSEYEHLYNLWISPSGYITIKGGFSSTEIISFKPDFSFNAAENYFDYTLYKAYADSMKLIFDRRPETVYYLNETERLLTFECTDQVNPKYDKKQIVLFYIRSNKVTPIVRYNQRNIVINPLSGREIHTNYVLLGNLLFRFLPNNRIAYMHSIEDCNMEPQDSTYTITTLSLTDSRKTQFTHRYTPAPLIYDEKRATEELKAINPVLYNRQSTYDRIIEQAYTERKYAASLRNLFTDTNSIFAITNFKNDTGEFLTDVFNADTGEYIASAYLPYGFVKNGYLYRINENYAQKKEQPVIEKYKLNPAVYGK